MPCLLCHVNRFSLLLSRKDAYKRTHSLVGRTHSPFSDLEGSSASFLGCLRSDLNSYLASCNNMLQLLFSYNMPKRSDLWSLRYRSQNPSTLTKTISLQTLSVHFFNILIRSHISVASNFFLSSDQIRSDIKVPALQPNKRSASM